MLEAKRTLVRLARDGSLDPEHYATCSNRLEQDLSLLTLRDLTLDLCATNVLPAVLTPRSLDLTHLRTASWFHAVDPLTRFVTMDLAQAQAARDMGLPT